MSDNVALLRFLWSRHRFMLLSFVSLLAMSEAFLWTRPPTTSPESSTFAANVFFFGFFPALMWGIFAFDFVYWNNLESPETGYSRWLLRMPISTWKLAIVPLLMKTAWVTLLWCCIAITCWHFGESVPIVIPILSMAATGFWVSAIAWRPFRVGWHRFAALAVLAPIAVTSFAGLGVEAASPRLSAAIIGWIYVGEAVFFVAAVAFAFHTLPVARSNVAGTMPAKASPVGKRFWQWLDRDHDGTCSVHHHNTESSALSWHDQRRSRPYRARMLLFIVLPTFLFLLMMEWDPVAILVMGSIMIFVCGNSGAHCIVEPTAHSVTTTLPPYLAASPLASETIAWSRLRSNVINSLLFLTVCFVFLVCWFGFETNREAWMRWATAISEYPTVDRTPIAAGAWATAAITVALIAMAVGRTIAYQWVTMTGRTWVAISVVGVLVLCCSAITVAAGHWFFQQREWEETMASFQLGLTYIPNIVVTLLAIKAIALIGSLRMSYRSGAVCGSSINRALAVWLATCVLLATVLYALIPDARVTFAMSLAYMMLVLPISRIIVLPVAVQWNRHR
ncbi:hypothetical protein [Novipirellula artificiosorum]|uniref:Uncharacterized protein n=1 Tax=Novipirellula artificiosorum TaxID=2528016 RepID=A0A5C6DQG0_9BACT|nr:hypothetical protein [Novipirellula artificiosorum]TWU37019.1 hypothetical protein Poly41_31450 [Novipirellula artificiosorum]